MCQLLLPIQTAIQELLSQLAGSSQTPMLPLQCAFYSIPSTPIRRQLKCQQWWHQRLSHSWGWEPHEAQVVGVAACVPWR